MMRAGRNEAAHGRAMKRGTMTREMRAGSNGPRGTRAPQRGALRWPSRWAWAQAVLALAVTAVVALLWFARPQAGPIARLDGLVQDVQTQWRGRLAPGTTYPITLVQFDDASAARFGSMAPARPLLAEAIARVQAAQPRLTAIDLPMQGARPDGDAALAAAMRGGAPVLLPFALPTDSISAASASPTAPLPPVETPALEPAAAVPPALRAQAFLNVEGEPRSALRPARADAPPEPLLSAAKSLGHAQLVREADGAVRHELPALPLDGAAYPSLALRIAGDAMRQPWSEATLRWSRDLRWGTLRVSLDLLSRQGVNPYGPAGTFPSVSLADLVDGKVPDEALRHRIVILGVSARGAGAAFPTPFDAGLPEAERLATVVDNLLTGRTLTRPSWASIAELAALLALPLLCAALLARGRLWLGLLGVALLVGGGLAAAQWAFEDRFLVLALGHPLLAVAAASAGALGLRGLAAWSRRRAAWRRLKLSEERHVLAAQGANDGLWDWDIATDRLEVSARWLALMGDAASGAGGGSAAAGTRSNEPPDGIARFTRPLDDAAAGLFRAELDAHLQGRSLQFHHVLRFEQGGQRRALLARGVAVRRDGKPVRMAGALTDLSEQERLYEQAAQDALRDRLTGLPNRALFMELIAQRLANPTPGVPIGLVLLGLDDFRAFVERQGPVAADAVLVECARRLAGGTGRAARSGRVVARLDADRFGVLFDARIEAGALVDRVPEWALARIEEPFLFETIEEASAGSRTGAHRLTASAGWAFTGQGNFSPDDLFAAAESALARAKAAGTGHARLFDPTQPRIEASRRALREDLERGLQAGEFQLDYQPIVRLSDRALLGFEALIRWRHPSRGPVLPDDLIPAAEESGHLMAIGRWTLIEAALQLRRWREIGFKGEVAINLSAAQLAQGDVLLADAREALKALGEVPPSQLRLEVPERAAMAWPQCHAEVLQALARLGFGLSIDDVGSAQSSLAHLHRFPVDTLKIDRSFVTRLGEGGEAQEVVRTIVGLARARGWRTLAEGVETQAQAVLLETLGVEMAQGWLFAQALPAEEARRLIQTVPWKKPAASPPPARPQAMP